MNSIPKSSRSLLLLGGSAIALYFVATRLVGGDLKRVAESAVDLVNPASSGNIAARTADGITQAVTGQGGTSFGSFLFDLFNDEFDPNAPAGESAIDTPENIHNGTLRLDPNVFLLDPFGPSVDDQLRAAGLIS